MVQEMARGFSLFEEALLGFVAQDPNLEQHTKVAAAIQNAVQDFPGGLLVNSPQANARDTGLILDRGRLHMTRGN